jgi:hypothetical protein
MTLTPHGGRSTLGSLALAAIAIVLLGILMAAAREPGAALRGASPDPRQPSVDDLRELLQRAENGEIVFIPMQFAAEETVMIPVGRKEFLDYLTLAVLAGDLAAADVAALAKQVGAWTRHEVAAKKKLLQALLAEKSPTHDLEPLTTDYSEPYTIPTDTAEPLTTDYSEPISVDDTEPKTITGGYRCPGLGRMWFTESAGGKVSGGYDWSGGGTVDGVMSGDALVGMWRDQVGSGDTNYKFNPGRTSFEHFWRWRGAEAWSNAGVCSREDR